MHKKTYIQKPADVKRQWRVVDAAGRILGDVATEISIMLMGKQKPTFTPHVDGGDYVVVVNAAQVEVTGTKLLNKKYFSYSGFPGGLRVRTFAEVMAKKPAYVFNEGSHAAGIAPQELSALLWIVAAFILIMLIVGVLMAVARYVSETAVIRMVDEYEGAGSKMTVRQGFRIGWSRASSRLFLINLIVNLPAILLVALLIISVVIISMMIVSGKEAFAVVSIVTMIGVVFLAIFAVVILSIFLRLLRQFFWRVCVLEDVGVGESFRRGFLMVRENWKNVGLMWLVMDQNCSLRIQMIGIVRILAGIPPGNVHLTESGRSPGRISCFRDREDRSPRLLWLQIEFGRLTWSFWIACRDLMLWAEFCRSRRLARKYRTREEINSSGSFSISFMVRLK